MSAQHDPTGGNGYICDETWRRVERALVRGDITDVEYESLARDEIGLWMPRCPRCGWYATPRSDTAAHRRKSGVEVATHKAECVALHPDLTA